MSLRFESLESAVRISQGHLEDVPEDPNLAAVYVCEEDSCIINRRDCQETTSTKKNSEYRENNRVKTRLSKPDHVPLLRQLYGSRTSVCTAHVGVPVVASFRKKDEGKTVFPTETPDHFWHLFMACVVGGDTFSPLAPLLGPVFFLVRSFFFTVHGGEDDTKMCNIRIGWCKRHFEIISVGSYKPRDRNTRNRTDLPLRPKATGN